MYLCSGTYVSFGSAEHKTECELKERERVAKMRYGGVQRRRVPLQLFLIMCLLVTALVLLLLSFKSLDDAPTITTHFNTSNNNASSVQHVPLRRVGVKSCATVEQMGQDFRRGVGKESLRVRRIIHNHFLANGTFRVLATTFFFLSNE